MKYDPLHSRGWPDGREKKRRKKRSNNRTSVRMARFVKFALKRFPYCQWCGIAVSKGPVPRKVKATADHLTPVCRGGGDDWDNLVLACRACNEEKSDQHWCMDRRQLIGPRDWRAVRDAEREPYLNERNPCKS